MKNFSVLLHSEFSCVLGGVIYYMSVSGWGGRIWAGEIKACFKPDIIVVYLSWIWDSLVHWAVMCKVWLFPYIKCSPNTESTVIIVMHAIKSFWSLHAGSINENDQLKELLALMKEDLTPAEKIYVRKSIEQHKLGTNKTILQQVQSKVRGWEREDSLCLMHTVQQIETENHLSNLLSS